MSDQDQQVVQQTLNGSVLELVIDNPPVNALGAAVRIGLAAGIARADADADVHAVVIRAKGRTFPAGADISEFGKTPVAPILPDLCNQIEACSKPVIAALHGTALGGGLEVALAAHYRVALADARLGLPEVQLGILPGAGGTQRLPRLIGAQQALGMMLGGRPIGAAQALAMGLLERVVESGLEVAAHEMAVQAIGEPLVQTRDRRDGMRDGLAYQAAVVAARRSHKAARLPGIPRIIDCVEAAQLLPFDAGLVFERAAFDELVITPEAAALRHAFFAERAARRIPEAKATARKCDHIGVMGSAGAELVRALLQAGFRVTLVEPVKSALVAALERVAAELELAVQGGGLTTAQRDADWARLVPAMDAASLAKCDLVLVYDSELGDACRASDTCRCGDCLAAAGRRGFRAACGGYAGYAAGCRGAAVRGDRRPGNCAGNCGDGGGLPAAVGPNGVAHPRTRWPWCKGAGGRAGGGGADGTRRAG